MDEVSGPLVATVIPVYNEEAHVRRCLESLLSQTLEADKHMILVLDGGSTDATRSVVESIIEEHDGSPALVLMDNPGRTVAHARNLALSCLPDSVEFLVEMIGHAVVESTHLAQRLEAWEACEAMAGERLAGVGVKVIAANEPTSRVARWIEGALASPFGQSGGQFANIQKPELTSVPAFVTHRRKAVEAVGGWDEAFITSQDSDLSMRLQKAGYLLYRAPQPEVAMHKRSTLRQWWKMGHRYGFWRTKVLLKHPTRAKWQEFLPLVGLGAVVASWWWVPAWAAGLALTYLLVLLLTGGQQARRQRMPTSMLGVPLCLLMLHTSFTIGLVDGLLRRGRLPNDRT